MAELKVLRTNYEIMELCSYLSAFNFVSYDVETTGLTRHDKIIGISVCAEETKAFYIVLQEWNKDLQSLIEFDVLDGVYTLLNLLNKKQLIMHNAVFDCAMTEYNFKIKLIVSLHTDTMVLAHLIDENRRIGLKELASNIFGEDSTKEQAEMKASVLANGGKLTKNQYEMFKCDSEIIGKYGAKDALLTLKLFYHLVPQLFDQGLDKFFYEEESMPLLKGPTYQLNTVGLKVDQDALVKLKKTLEAECMEAKAFVYSEIDNHIKEKYPGTSKSNTFNIGSSQQLSWLLFGKLELEFGNLTDSGKTICRALNLKTPYTFSSKREFIAVCNNSLNDIHQPEAIVNGRVIKPKTIKEPWKYIACDKKTLTKLAPRFKWIQRLLEYQRKMKILNTYVKGIESRVEYGIISPSFLQTGTTSGRYSSRNPNFQNLPRDDKRIKECIVARPGKVFVGADYSQLEPRVFAYFSKDERLLKAFQTEDDFYSVIGMEVYDKYGCLPRKEGPNSFGVLYKKLRDDSKIIALAVTYGATAHQLAPTTGKSIDDTQRDIDNYFERFPGVKQMMLDSHEMAKTDGQVINLFGRPRRMPEAKRINKLYGNIDHAELPYEARNILNLAVNHRIQATSASIVNRSAIRLHENLKISDIENANLILQVHDYLVVECLEKDAESVSLIMRDAMENTIDLKTIKLEAIPKTAKNLSKV